MSNLRRESVFSSEDSCLFPLLGPHLGLSGIETFVQLLISILKLKTSLIIIGLHSVFGAGRCSLPGFHLLNIQIQFKISFLSVGAEWGDFWHETTLSSWPKVYSQS